MTYFVDICYRIYWTDAGEKKIDSCNLDGSNRHTIIETELPHPFGITLDETRIYWSDWDSKTISSADKVTGTSFLTELSAFIERYK